MDIVIAKDIVIGLAAVLAAGLAIWNFFQSPSKKNEGEIQTLRGSIDLLRKEVAGECRTIDDKVDALTGRVSTLETVMHQMPDKDSLHRLELGLERMSGEINMLSAKLIPVENLSRRLQEFMLERGSR